MGNVKLLYTCSIAVLYSCFICGYKGLQLQNSVEDEYQTSSKLSLKFDRGLAARAPTVFTDSPGHSPGYFLSHGQLGHNNQSFT